MDNELLNDLGECGICMDNESNVILNCNHKLCYDCYIHEKMTKCPFCRKSFTRNLVRIDEYDKKIYTNNNYYGYDECNSCLCSCSIQ